MRAMLIGTVSGLFWLASCTNLPNDTADTNVPEQVASKAAEFDLPYEKFVLENGLEVVLHIDRSDPIVAVTTVVHAGSNRERLGRTGFAHFFEHMAFNDSENVPRGWNRKAIPDWGGQRNGGTWSDGTIYYEVVPKDAFDKILWIDSDRLGYMINTVTEAALEREKQVVKNEKRQRVDNAPYGYTQEVIRTALYPEGHPYSWTVIGSLPDLQAATLDDLREFYDRYYGAANATLVIAGDIDVEETRAKVERWFGEIRRGPDVEPLPPMPVTLEETKSLYFEDNFATLPELRITLPSVEAYHPDETALNALAQLLAGSKGAPLYDVMVNTRKLAPDVRASNRSNELAGEFVIATRANAGVDLDEVLQAIEVGLAKFEADGVNERDLQGIKIAEETNLYGRLSTVLGKSNQMAQDNEFARDPAFAVKSAERLGAVTAEDIMRVYTQYVKDQPYILTSFVPKGEVVLAVDGAEQATVWIEEVVSGVANEEVSQGEEADYKRTPSKYDRSEPPFGDLPLLQVPDIWQAELGHGVELYGIENNETPLVNFIVNIDAGAAFDEQGKEGAAALLARLLNEGTQTRTSADLEQALSLLGSGIEIDATHDEIRIRGTSLARNFDQTIDLVTELLSAPRWQEADFERVKAATLTDIRGREASPGAIGRQAFDQLLYGATHPLGRPADGSINSVGALTLSDLQAYYEDMLSASARIHVTGNITSDDAMMAFEQVADVFERTPVARPGLEIPEQDAAGKVYFIDVPSSKQSVIYAGKMTVPTTHPDANPLQFANEKLGGGISGDLAQVLRIEKGYTYGAYSSVSDGLDPQAFRAATSVRANATEASLRLIRDMLTAYGPDFNDDFVELTQQKLLKENTRAYESLTAKLGMLQEISKYGKPVNFLEIEQQELLNMPLVEYRRVIAEHLQEPEMTYVIVGDGATQLDPVRAFAGGAVTVLDIYGRPIEQVAN